MTGACYPQHRHQEFLAFLRQVARAYPRRKLHIVCDNFSLHLSTRKDRRVGTWAKANNVEIAYTPTNSSWLNRIEAQFTAAIRSRPA